MRSNRCLVVSLCLIGLLAEAVLASSCGGSGATSSAGKSGGTGASTGAGGTTSTGSSMGGGVGGASFTTSTGTGGAAMCTTAADCDGGVCNAGMCCDTAAHACGTQCCKGATVCLFDECVTPGADCTTATDCPMGQYCETALGGGADGGPDGGVIGDAGVEGGVCSEPLPLLGKCLPLPTVCPADGGAGGAGAVDGGCVPDCEYHPPVVATLDAEVRWQWGPTATAQPDYTDVWASPVVGRVYDTNCDGVINDLDAPVVIFVSGNDFANAASGSNCQTATTNMSSASMCHTGALRMLDGNTGEEIWTNAAIPGSIGFAGTSVAIGDVDGDGFIDIVALTGEGYVVMLDRYGNLERKSDKPYATSAGDEGDAAFGWGGGLAIADMLGDGFPDIAFGSTVFTTTGGAITLKFTGTGGIGGGDPSEALSTFVDLDQNPNKNLELLAGNTAYNADGTVLWHRADLPDGFPGVGDFNGDGKPDVVLVGPLPGSNPAQAYVWLLNGADGTDLIPTPVHLTTTVHASDGGPPTVADFDGDGSPEIGVATADFYWVVKPNFTTMTIDVVWQMPNHDYSSSVTGSTVFDFEGAGHPSVVYADECYLWVFDGATGAVRFAAPHTSFTGTEASLLADVDGDGHAELLMVSNGADPSANGWKCMDAAGTPVVINGVTWTPNPAVANKSYRGLVSFGDTAHSWVGTRTLWNEHTYHVSNICDDTDSACPAPNVYGSIPTIETENWTLPWLNNFRQNVQDKGIFNAPQAIVSLTVDCTTPVLAHASVRNIGLASLPAGVTIGIFKHTAAVDTQVGTGTTTQVLFPGQTQEIDVLVNAAMANSGDQFVAKVLIDPAMPLFHECDPSNNTSAVVSPLCSMAQ
jgi:hypothetical protein